MPVIWTADSDEIFAAVGRGHQAPGLVNGSCQSKPEFPSRLDILQAGGSTMLTLYDAPGACSMAAHIALEKAGATPLPGEPGDRGAGVFSQKLLREQRARRLRAHLATGALYRRAVSQRRCQGKATHDLLRPLQSVAPFATSLKHGIREGRPENPSIAIMRRWHLMPNIARYKTCRTTARPCSSPPLRSSTRMRSSGLIVSLKSAVLQVRQSWRR